MKKVVIISNHGERSTMNKEHTFAICAYGESPYLEACIRSVKNQTVPSQVMLTTSTPCSYIENLCRKYKIPYFINKGSTGITQDWNFAYAAAQTPIVTIAHQDDLYGKSYTQYLLSVYKNTAHPLIFFTDYYELRNDCFITDSKLLRIKRAMLLPFRITFFQESIFVRRRILSLGCPICCPSVAFFKENLPEIVFLNHFRTNEDWEAWERISRQKGQFLYCNRPLVAHRIHKDSVTLQTIEEKGRTEEDMEMYCKFWPCWIARLFCRCYKKSEALNKIKT